MKMPEVPLECRLTLAWSRARPAANHDSLRWWSPRGSGWPGVQEKRQKLLLAGMANRSHQPPKCGGFVANSIAVLLFSQTVACFNDKSSEVLRSADGPCRVILATWTGG